MSALLEAMTSAVPQTLRSFLAVGTQAPVRAQLELNSN